VSAPRDTPQQQAILRRHKTARKVRRDSLVSDRWVSCPCCGRGILVVQVPATPARAAAHISASLRRVDWDYRNGVLVCRKCRLTKRLMVAKVRTSQPRRP
jgi:transcription elongation factor Elf1